MGPAESEEGIMRVRSVGKGACLTMEKKDEGVTTAASESKPACDPAWGLRQPNILSVGPLVEDC